MAMLSFLETHAVAREASVLAVLAASCDGNHEVVTKADNMLRRPYASVDWNNGEVHNQYNLTYSHVQLVKSALALGLRKASSFEYKVATGAGLSILYNVRNQLHWTLRARLLNFLGRSDMALNTFPGIVQVSLPAGLDLMKMRSFL